MKNDKKKINFSYIIRKNETNNYDIEDKESIDKNSYNLPGLYFYDFLFNNIYCKKFCSSNKQEIINICNNIISKYYSIDNIVYNQLRLENLFKDYNWNDPGLNTIKNNKMINELELLNI